MSALYDQYDKNGDGKVSVQELKRGIQSSFCADIDDQTVVSIFQGLDMDGDKYVTKEEFLDQMCSKIDRRVAFTNQFNQLDSDKNGYLSRDEVRSMLKDMYDDDQITEMFQQCDANNDGKVVLDEFLKLM